MERSILSATVAGVLGLALTATRTSRPAVAAGDDQAVLQADRSFMQATAKSDKTAADRLLDSELLWTDSDGKTQSKVQIVQNLPASTIAEGAAAEEHTYGQVATVRTDSGKLHVLRVWAKRPAGWRLLVYHEVRQAEKAGAGSGPAVKECVNPCKTVPYQPKNDAEAGVIKSWQALETAVTAGDAEAWSPHFADEFVVISSGATEPTSKAGRMAILDRQKQAGTNSAPAGLAPGHTRMFDLGETVVMTCQSLPHSGKLAHITRVWIKRGAMWQMTVSFQTTIQAAAAVGAT